MSDVHELARRIKGIRAPELGRCWLRGDVVSPKWDEEAEDWVKGPLIISIWDGGGMLGTDRLEQLPQPSKLHDGMTVALIPGGEKFLILGVVSDAV